MGIIKIELIEKRDRKMVCDYKNCKEEAETIVHWSDKIYSILCLKHTEKYFSNSEILNEPNIEKIRLS